MIMRISYEKRVRAPSRNERFAAEVRRALESRGMVALNVIGSPGSGKTSLIEHTAAWCRRNRLPAAALTGAPATRDDAERVVSAGIPAIQITTGDECRLDAARILNRLGDEELVGARLLLIENVGNLICPATYDLGEHAKVALLSVPEGDDKPLKYPGVFERAELLLINKVDMLELTDFQIDRAARNARRVAPDIEIQAFSCRTGEGLEEWFSWVEGRLREVRPRPTLAPWRAAHPSPA